MKKFELLIFICGLLAGATCLPTFHGIRKRLSILAKKSTNAIQSESYSTTTKQEKRKSNKEKDEIMNIWNSYIWTAEWRNKCKEDPRSY